MFSQRCFVYTFSRLCTYDCVGLSYTRDLLRNDLMEKNINVRSLLEYCE